MEIAFQTMMVAEVRAILSQRCAEIAAELEELRTSGVRLVAIGAQELLMIELAGFTCDLVTGECSREIEPVREVLGIPVVGEVNAETGQVRLQRNGEVGHEPA